MCIFTAHEDLDVNSAFWCIQYVLSGFPQHLTSYFYRSSSNRNNKYAFSNDRTNYFASCSGNSGSFMNYPG